ncbi:MAG TPA: hypothetical protein VNU49_09685 [Opitutaceae bacterium]|jgi:hypothetical protein|nr:hypothetical protein [Opitutaceae bacterium]
MSVSRKGGVSIVAGVVDPGLSAEALSLSKGRRADTGLNEAGYI